VKPLVATVEAVCLSTPGRRIAKIPQEEAFLGPHGFIGDRHEAEFLRNHWGQVYPNTRQWSAVSTEEVAALCADMGVPTFAPGELGENLLLSGVILANIPKGAVIEFPGGARLLVAGQNDPCVNAAKDLSNKYGAVVGQYFVKQAWGRRGLIGSVLESGPIRVGDNVSLLIPQPMLQHARSEATGFNL
jgi:MOSC domain-containing protein YiiM